MKHISVDKKQQLKEHVAHGDHLFRMSVHKSRIDQDHKVILYFHWHEEAEVLVITKGCAKVQIGSKYYRLKEGEYVFIQPNEVHGAYPLEAGQVEFFAVVIHRDFLSSFFNDIIQQKYIYPIYEGNSVLPAYFSEEDEHQLQILPLMRDIVEVYFERNLGYEILVKARIYEILYRLYHFSGRDELEIKELSTMEQRIKHVLIYMKENYTKKIELKDLADLIPISEGHLCKYFKKHLSMPPMEYLNGLRISEAAKLLRTTDKKLIDIAILSGFNSESYFVKVFKIYMKCTPTQYRKRRLE